MSPDRESAEFAVVVADAWQGRGVARALMEPARRRAKAAGCARLEGLVLRSEPQHAEIHRGVRLHDARRPGRSDQVDVVLELRRAARRRATDPRCAKLSEGDLPLLCTGL